ncbi:MAG: tetratricopeptide repeat protein, partial [Chitinophagales bacterium]|nr:tetratricopeptide repeat protein [Chitinophagales bacterium]
MKSFENLEKGFRMSKKLNWDRAYADYYQTKAYLKQYSSEHDLAHIYLDSAISYFNKAAKTATTKKDTDDIKLGIATCLSSKADILLKRGRGAEAIEVYLAALEAWKSSDQPHKVEAIAIYYTRISTTYYELKQYEKALEYDKLSLETFLTTNNEESIIWAYLYVSDDFNRLKRIDSGLFYLQKAAPMVKRLNNHRINASYYGKLGHISTLK